MKLISLWSIEDEPTPTLAQMASAIAEATDAGVDIDARPSVWWNDNLARYEWAFEIPEDISQVSAAELAIRLGRAIGPMMSGEPEEIWLELKARLGA